MQHKTRETKRYPVCFWQLAIVTVLLLLVTGCAVQQPTQQIANDAPEQQTQQISGEQPAEQQNSKSSSDDIGVDKAKQIALQHAGVAEGDTQEMEVKQEQEHGRLIYEVEFEVGHIDYEYEIDGASGEILKAETD